MITGKVHVMALWSDSLQTIKHLMVSQFAEQWKQFTICQSQDYEGRTSQKM